MPIKMLAAPDCPHVSPARHIITDCLTGLGLDVPIVDRVGRYPHRSSSSTAST